MSQDVLVIVWCIYVLLLTACTSWNNDLSFPNAKPNRVWLWDVRGGHGKDGHGRGKNGQEGFPDGKMAKMGIMEVHGGTKLGMEDGISLSPVTKVTCNFNIEQQKVTKTAGKGKKGFQMARWRKWACRYWLQGWAWKYRLQEWAWQMKSSLPLTPVPKVTCNSRVNFEQQQIKSKI